ncbi:hypothetical protein [Phocaeicola barnesiae]|uniref:hypothetical protein n=1 Tax=Phocaeicola barnesiae TaxID=376804 RepID=UPI0024309729|nr:hypothetical protein [Phocaeicola barnesiae]
MLSYLMLDIPSFIRLVAVNGTQLLDALRRDEKRTLVADRIVSIFQPHARPLCVASAGNGCLLDWYVLFCKECDEVP